MGHSVKQIRKQFAEQGVFYTDEKLARLLASEVSKYGEVKEVYDPTCGDGNLLAVFPDEVEKFGQEIDEAQAKIASERLTNAHIVAGDTLKNPAFLERKFNHIVANYPFSIKWEPFDDDRWRDAPTLPPPSKADYAFILHIVSMLSDNGVAVVLGFPGILYRGQREGKIREWLVRQNLIESVTLIEGGYFEDTSISTALIVFRKGKANTDIKFVDHEKGLEKVATFDDVVKNDFNLSPNGYITIEEKKEAPGLVELEIKARKQTIYQIDAQLQFSKQVTELHKTLGLAPLPPLSDFVKEIITTANKYI